VRADGTVQGQNWKKERKNIIAKDICKRELNSGLLQVFVLMCISMAACGNDTFRWGGVVTQYTGSFVTSIIIRPRCTATPEERP